MTFFNDKKKTLFPTFEDCQEQMRKRINPNIQDHLNEIMKDLNPSITDIIFDEKMERPKLNGLNFCERCHCELQDGEIFEMDYENYCFDCYEILNQDDED